MRLDRFAAVVRREYMTRVRTKGFWIATAAFPLLFGAMTVGPSLIAEKQREQTVLGFVDETGRIEGGFRARVAELAGAGNFPVEIVSFPPGTAADSLDARVLRDDVDAYIVVTESSIQGSEVSYHARVTTNFQIQQIIRQELDRLFTRDRLTAGGFDPERIAELTTRLRLDTVGVGADGDAGGGETRFFFAFIIFMMLYLMIAIHGQNIMRSIIEERSSKIVDVLITALKPTELLFGKIAGVSGATLTQLFVWVTSAALIRRLLADSLTDSIGALPSLPPSMLVHLVLFFVMGFLLYASLFAMVGATHTNDQEAQQYVWVVSMPLMACAFILMGVVTAPSSTLNVVLSVIPFFAPLIMLTRMLVSSVPAWQVAVSYALLAAMIALLLTGAARVYRVGILMTGKRPTLGEIVRWIRQAS